MDLVNECSDEEMIEVLRDERAGDVALWERQEEEEEQEGPSTPEKVDKAIDVDFDNHDLEEVRYHQFSKLIIIFCFQNKSDEMECDQAPQALTESAQKDGQDEKDAASTSDCNKENVGSETESSERTSKAKEASNKLIKPFTTVNPKAQKKALTPGSRGAMLLNLSRRTKDSEVTKSSPASTGSLISSPRSCPPQALGQGPRPWVKYAPSPSHASPSAGILKSKRTADELDTSSDVSFKLTQSKCKQLYSFRDHQFYRPRDFVLTQIVMGLFLGEFTSMITR